jgi:hypothetical protein
MPTVPPQTRGLSRARVAIAFGVLLLFGIGMGCFLNWVSNTPRSTKPSPTGEQQDEPGKADVSKPGMEDRLDFVADFGEVAPLPAFTAAEMPATAKTEEKSAAKSEEKQTLKPKAPEGRIDTVPNPPKQATVPQDPPRVIWKLKAGDTFFQELIVSQKPTFRTQGLVLQSFLKYSVLSKFIVEEAGAAGVTINQRIEGSRLLQSDATTQGLVVPALAKMPGTSFKIILGPDLQVKRFTGNGPQLLVGGGAIPGGFGLQTASLMDLDGWREMAQATFFQPPGPQKPQTNWLRPMSHNWGPLGGWVGQTLFVYSGRQGALHQFNYGHRMNHVPPRGGMGGLPFQVAGAAFQPREAVGSIVFDSERGRVVSGQERFAVTGRINIVLLGQQSPVEIEEVQTFQFRIIDSPGK